jgi:tripartite-type tricarboxylate transporter receptor subunit TctC
MKRFIAALAALALASPALAADYPQRPIRILVPFTPGGSTDILARMLGQKLTDAWGYQAIVDNRAGANGVVAAELTARANPDGHTLMMVAIGHAINASLQKKLPYDTEKDFTPISLTAVLPLLVAVHPSSKATSMKELVTQAKARTISYASGGIGSSQHLAGELINSMGKIKMNHIPYKGGNQGTLDLVAGHVEMMASTILTVAPHVKAGKLRALAITTAKRSPAWPEIPTVSESALKGYESVAWYGIVGPAKLQPAVLDKLSGEIIKGTKSADMQSALVKQGADPVGSTPKQFSSFIQSEMTKYSKVIREAGIKPE